MAYLGLGMGGLHPAPWIAPYMSKFSGCKGLLTEGLGVRWEWVWGGPVAGWGRCQLGLRPAQGWVPEELAP